MYLTYTEYNDYGFAEIDNMEFNRLVKKAGDVLDSITRNFYQFNDLESDHEFRRTKFKKAVACQIEYFYEMGATNSHGLKDEGTVTIGRTTVSSGDRNSSNQSESPNNIISDDVYTFLNGTGLLYKGIGVV